MSLHPITALDHIIDEYRDYLRTEFQAKDIALRQALEDELTRRGFLAQEPFFQAYRPFKTGMKWVDLPLDARLADVMEGRARRHGSRTPEYAYLHQSAAIAELRQEIALHRQSGVAERRLGDLVDQGAQHLRRFADEEDVGGPHEEGAVELEEVVGHLLHEQDRPV